MAIYRGTGGAGDSTTDATVSDVTEQATIASTKASEAAASATSAATSASQAASSATSAANSAANAASVVSGIADDAAAAEAAKLAAQAAQAAAELAETGAETAETNAETAETNAASSASAASTSATNAANSASSAATSASNASTSASAAATSATDAATSASSAATSATSAATSAGTATTQATAAAASATSASNSATAAASSASAASTSATNAATSETNAATSAANASTSETNASASETAAAGSATSASTSASNAATSATSASNSASAASTSATNAASSATAAAGSASAASASADAALAALDNFDDRYLGQKASAPTVDNDGDPLVTGALYFDTVDDAMKVWDGTQWLNAYASLSGALIANNNLSDLTNAATARTNLGLGTAATTDSTAYATAAQGALADAALPASSYTAADVLTKVKTVDGSGSGLDADLLDGQQGTYYAAASSLSNYLPLTGGTLSGALDVTGIVTADGLTVNGNSVLDSSAGGDVLTLKSNAGVNHTLTFQRGAVDVGSVTASFDGIYTNGYQIQKLQTAGTDRILIAYNGDISFYEDTGTTAKLFWDASTERLGIGNTSPATALDVTGTVTADGLVVDGSGEFVGVSGVQLKRNTIPASAGTGSNMINWQLVSDGSTYTTGASIQGLSDGAWSATSAPMYLSMRTVADGTTTLKERLKIANNGDVSFYEDTSTTAKFFWDASAERLGLGTTSPATTLDVNGTVTADGLTLANATYIRQNDSASAQPRVFGFNASNDMYIGPIDSYAGGNVFYGVSGNVTSQVFYTATDQRLRIANNGDISFYEDTGTTAKFFWDASAEGLALGQTSLLNNGTLTVKGDGKQAITSIVSNNANSLFQGFNSSASLAFQVTGAGNGYFAGTVTADGLTVDGDVLLNGDRDLHLVATNPNTGTSFQYGELTFGDSFSGQYNNHAKIISNGGYANTTNLEFHTSANNSSPLRMLISSNGDISFYEDTGTTAKFFWDASAESLGIGTTPYADSQLHLANSSTSTGLEVSTGAAVANTVRLFAYNRGTGTNNDLLVRSANFIVQTNGTNERMRIDSAGNLLVGKTSSGSTIDGVELIPQGAIYAVRPNNVTGVFNRRSSDGDILHFRKDGTTVGSVGVAAGNANFSGVLNEVVYNLTGTALDPDNGGIQTKTLTANTTLTDSLTAGQSMTLMIDDGSAYTITWPTITWLVSGGSAPTLETTGYTAIVLWKVGSTLYGKY